MNQSANDLIPRDDPAETGRAGEADVEEDSRCDCEFPGPYFTGVPGIVAHVENGRLAEGATVERCGLCRRYLSDATEFAKLRDLGIA